MMISIRRALFKSLSLALVIGTLVVCVTAYFASREEVNEMFDGQMQQAALTIKAEEDQTGNHLQSVHGQNPALEARTEVKGEKEFLIQIWDKDGKLSYSSHPAIKFPMHPGRGLKKKIVFNGEDWRVYSLPRNGEVVQVSQPMSGRKTMADEITLKLLLPALVQFPIFAFFGWMAVRRSLKPLKAVSTELGQRSATVMSPVDIAEVPEEIQPLGQALNDLLSRLDTALTQQRQFTADAAHELRTPLAAIQLQMELLTRAKTDAEKAEAQERLSQGIARAVHLVQQLLVFARVEPQASAASVPVELGALLKESVAQFAPAAHRKNISASLDRCEKVQVAGDADKLQILVNNLLENAIRYTQDGGGISASLAANDAGAVLEVSDNGPGIPEAERQRVFDRFYRIAGSKAQGTGLGLAIVKKIADQHGATVTLADGPGGKGLAVKVLFPRAA